MKSMASRRWKTRWFIKLIKEKTTMTDKEKMISGKIYDASVEELAKGRAKAHRLCTDYNQTYEEEEEKRLSILKELIPTLSKGVYLQGPIQFDYGYNTTIGENSYANFNFTVLDCSTVTIGRDVFFGPNVSLVTPLHPYLPEERRMRFREDGSAYDLEYAKPIVIGDDCWFGSNVTVIGGVTIGSGTIIGAGSVVTKDIPSGVLAAGNPCRVIREITEADSIELKKELW